MIHGCCLCNFIPVILNCATPKSADDGLVGSAGAVVEYAQRFDFLECVSVFVARQGRRWAGTELARPLQRKRSYMRPDRELRLFRKIGWCGLKYSRSATENKWRRLNI